MLSLYHDHMLKNIHQKPMLFTHEIILYAVLAVVSYE